MREEFGFQRITCSCRKCSLWCEFVPGSLVPSDLDRLIPVGDDPLLWAVRPGGDLSAVQVPTGIGDGRYRVEGRFKVSPLFGRRLAQIRVQFLDQYGNWLGGDPPIDSGESEGEQ